MAENPEPSTAIIFASAAFGLLLFLVMLASAWKVFTKAGQPGWACIVPIYNFVVMLQIVGRPLWWIILCFIPLVNVLIMIVLAVDIAKSFGKDTLFGIGMLLLPIVFYPVLAFGDARYHGPSALSQG